MPFHILQQCSGDLSFASTKSFDVEIYTPASNEWLEVSSCSNCTDFQARRSNIKYRTEAGARPRFLHTLNGSGLAVGRTLIAILENGQRADGTIHVPYVLRPYLNGREIIEADA